MKLKPLPIGNQTFRKIIRGEFLYVDKTKWLYELINNPSAVYFISRPRRFGKSLLISTLDEIFQGNRDLFKGLWLDDSPYQWEQHPVIRIDFSAIPVRSAEELEQSIKRVIRRIAHQHQVTINEGSYVAQFDDLIFEMAQQNQVAILIDEYDKPILDNIENTAEAERIRDVLKRFYGIIKSMDAHIRFVLLTGISKFSRVGVFSDLNSLDDLTMDSQYSAMLGITQDELEENFADYLHAFAQEREKERDVLLAQIKKWYNGFCFSRRCQPVYNPFSLLLLFKKHQFQNYWFESGTPTFLIKLLKKQQYDLQQLENLQLSELAFSTYDIENLDIIPLLFQTGYLTIKEYEDRFQTYTLSYPNYEVKRSFMTYLLHAYSETNLAFSSSSLKKLSMALFHNDLEQFFDTLNSFLATIDYMLHIKQEKYYQTIFYLIFRLIGLEIHAEVRTNQGRIDAVVETEDAVFIFEFKLDKSAAIALAQIKEKKYFAPYLLKEKPLYLVGVNFNMETREITEWATSSE